MGPSAALDTLVALRTELVAHALVLPWADYRPAFAHVEDAGERALHVYAWLFSSDTWIRANAALPRPCTEGDLVRILGFGATLTEFLGIYALEGASPEVPQSIVQLGALANIIVSLYDYMMDESGGRDLLPAPVLRKLSMGRGTRFSGMLHAPQRRVVQRLVGEYFRRLRSASDDPEHSVIGWLRSMIFQMYEAETRTLQTRNSCPDRALRRKAALPFVVMGVPIWLHSMARRADMWAHLAWMYRFGDFTGWLDDFADLTEDVKHGRPNRLARVSAPDRARQARRVAASGSRVLRQWQVRRSCGKATWGANLMRALVTSWVGT